MTLPISAGSIVADILQDNPGIVEVFVQHGFGEIRNPLLQKTLARKTTIAQACKLKRIPMESLLAALNEYATSRVAR